MAPVEAGHDDKDKIKESEVPRGDGERNRVAISHGKSLAAGRQVRREVLPSISLLRHAIRDQLSFSLANSFDLILAARRDFKLRASVSYFEARLRARPFRNRR